MILFLIITKKKLESYDEFEYHQKILLSGYLLLEHNTHITQLF